MKYKFIFGAAISTMLLGVAVAGLSHFSSKPQEAPKASATRSSALRAPDYDDSSFDDSVDLTRSDLIVDVQSITTTPAGKSATIAFNGSRLTGWPSLKRNVFTIIDDADFSGSTSNPSISGRDMPEFNGYTVEMDYIETFTLSYGTGESAVYRKEIVIPEVLEYAGKFSIKNAAIYEDSFIFTNEDRATKPSKERVEWIIIPDGIETIQSKAFQNVPSFIKFKCEAASKPAGWADDWFGDADPSQIEWGYTLVDSTISGKNRGNETDQLKQGVGSGEKYYGDLVYVAVDDAQTLYFVVDDANWTGDFSNPAKVGSSPYTFEGYLFSIEDSAANPDIIIPEKIVYNDITILIKKIPTDVIDFLYETTNTYTLSVTPTSATIVPSIDSAVFDEAYPDAKENTYFRFSENTSDPSKSCWYMGSKVVNLADYGISYTGTPKNNDYINVKKTSQTNYVGHINSITIPTGISEIAAAAFVAVPESVKIYCEYNLPSGAEVAKQPFWSDTWISTPKPNQVVWNHAVPASAKTLTVTNVSTQVRVDNDADTYILGYKHKRQDMYYSEEEKEYYYPEEIHGGKTPRGHDATLIPDLIPEYQLPLVISYEISKGNSIERKYVEMPLLSEDPTSTSTSHYDSVKTSVVNRTVDILLEEGESLDSESFRVHNVYRAKTWKVVGKTVEKDKVVEKVLTYTIPDTNVCFQSDALKRFDREIDINEVINYRFKQITSFSSYFVTGMEIDKVYKDGKEYWYTGIGEETAEEYEDFIERGVYSVRYVLSDMQSSFYRLTYYSPTAGENKQVTLSIDTSNGVVPLNSSKGNKVAFIVKNSDIYYKDGNKTIRDFKVENLRHFEIISLTINMHLWDNENNGKVGRTDYEIHFGAVDVMPLRTTAPDTYKIELFLLIFILGYTGLFAASAAALFFYLKNKFKNDEFRRMKPKQYLKTSILGYVGSIIIALTIVFVAFRAGRFSNSVSAHNPIDIFIVIPGVISVVVIGYFIKFTATKIKANKHRKTIKKLKLNDDTKDDGTN